MEQNRLNQPSAAFIGASWTALLIGITAFLIGLWNADMQLNEKGYYFTVLMFGLFSAISVQKAVRDQMEGIPVTNIYYGLAVYNVAFDCTADGGAVERRLGAERKGLLRDGVCAQHVCGHCGAEKHAGFKGNAKGCGVV
jgi:hypothetical protein